MLKKYFSKIIIACFLLTLCYACNSEEKNPKLKNQEWCISKIDYSEVINKIDTIHDNTSLLSIYLLSHENFPELQPHKFRFEENTISLLNQEDSCLVKSDYSIIATKGNSTILKLNDRLESTLYMSSSKKYFSVDKINYELQICQ